MNDLYFDNKRIGTVLGDYENGPFIAAPKTDGGAINHELDQGVFDDAESKSCNHFL